MTVGTQQEQGVPRMTEPEPERHFVIKFCDWCRIAVPVDVREGPAFDEEHRHDDT